MNILEWTSVFIDNIDSFRKDIKKKEICGNEITCVSGSKGALKYIAVEKLEESVLSKIKEGNIILSCLNTKENLSFVTKNWDEFIKNKNLKIIFANPELNVQWSLIPYTHNLISEPKTLKLGLKSIFDSVPEV